MQATKLPEGLAAILVTGLVCFGIENVLAVVNYPFLKVRWVQAQCVDLHRAGYDQLCYIRFGTRSCVAARPSGHDEAKITTKGSAFFPFVIVGSKPWP